MTRARLHRAVALALGGLALSGTATADADRQPIVSRDPGLIRPGHLTVDGSLSRDRLRLTVRRAQQLYTFWDTGSPTQLRRAVVPDFRDHTPPPGRRQGRAGVLAASRAFRAAIPDLSCEVADMTVVGDRITVRQVYRGHFTGTYEGVRGQGQAIRFNAIDIQQMGRTKIVGDWHIEDTAALETQLGVG